MRIDRTIDIKAPPERVWRALTDAKELGTWFQVKVEGEIAAGNEVWMVAQQKKEIRFRVLFVELTPPKRFSWQWHPGAVDPGVDYSKEPRTTVTFTLEPIPSGTRLTVEETGFNEVSLARRAKVFEDNTKGWAEVLVWLANYAQTAP
ncbi:MAG TPA: SRPBCC family protein [Bryobacteraceae bacterium]|nr:SRPBCC family protein [Bryobacteraceae bacterium]